MASGKIRARTKKPNLFSNLFNLPAQPAPVRRRRHTTFRDNININSRPSFTKPNLPPSASSPPPILRSSNANLNLKSSTVPLVIETPEKLLLSKGNRYAPPPSYHTGKKKSKPFTKRRLSDLLPRVPLPTRLPDQRFPKRRMSDLSSQVSFSAKKHENASKPKLERHRISFSSAPSVTKSDDDAPTKPKSSELSTSAPLTSTNTDDVLSSRKSSELPPSVSFLTESAEDLLAASALMPEVQPIREIRRGLRRGLPIPKQNGPDMSPITGLGLDTAAVQETNVKHVARVVERTQTHHNSVPQTSIMSSTESDAQIENEKNDAGGTENATLIVESGITIKRMPDRPGSPESVFLRVTDARTANDTKTSFIDKLPTLKKKLVDRVCRFPMLSRSSNSTMLRATPAEPENLLKRTKEVAEPTNENAGGNGNEERKTTKPRKVTAAPALSIEMKEQDSKTLIEEATTVEDLVEMLRKHGECIPITEQLLRKLVEILNDDESKEAMWLCGGIEVIIMVMGRYADMAQVQVDGAEVIAKSVYQHAENKDALVCDFGIDAVVAAMRGFTHHAEVQIRTCLALQNVAMDNTKYKEVIGMKGGVNAAIEALAAHGINSQVVEAATSVLHMLVCGVTLNVERLANSHDWAAVLLDVLGANANTLSDNVQSKLLDILAEGARIHLFSIGDGALCAALSAMSRNVHRKEVLSVGAAAARSLVENGQKDMDKALSAAGAVASLLDMLQFSVASAARVKGT